MPSAIPAEYRAAIPMLAVRDAAAALDFYKQVFDAVEVMRLNDDQGRIAHSEIRIGDAQVMIADSYPGENVTPDELGGTPVIIHMFVPDVDAILARAVKAGATILRPLGPGFGGTRNGKLRDPFGHVWLIQTQMVEQ